MSATASRTEALLRSRGPSPVHHEGAFGVAIDSREQRPLAFAESIPWLVTALPAGDYSVIGHESEIAIERKSLADLASSVTRDHARFERELERLASYATSAVVIECSVRDVLAGVRFSRVPGATILRLAAALEAKHRVPFHFAGDRTGAAIWTVSLLAAAWRRARRAKQIATVAELNDKLSSGAA